VDALKEKECLLKENKSIQSFDIRKYK